MGWMKFVAVIFNILGALLLASAIGAFVFGAAVGGSGQGSDAAAVGALMGGMIGSLVAFGNFVCAMFMFFFGAVLFGVRRLIEEVHLLQVGGHHVQTAV